ncbi:MAG TPA: protein translocase subunit SecDF [Bacteroidales bacterium]|nr:protein translocase subunit SecDF [Bacteroidales bacterium]HRR15293.1 protein translocase subunit SecDF [Bacteroidales bacterium]HRT46705.1 protein translocase subunit SecDF [Bacteroidales bacterium]HRU55882.1 protein translocase subunit SecDF [Bacteroidales bacterium]
MQNKGLIIVLAVTLAIVSLYQLSFTAATYKVKSDARKYAKGDLVKEVAYIDSMSALSKDQWSFLGYTFKECLKKELNLGLDLKGGMNVILEVSVEDILRALSNYNPDKTFNEALARARQRQLQTQGDFLTLFANAFTELDPQARLASIFGTVEMKDKINFNSTNEEVIKVLEKEIDNAINNAFNILRTRIDRFGVTQPNISQLSTKGRILIELPGVNNPQRVRELLSGTANLEFWETYENSEMIGYLVQANNLLREILANTQKQADSLKLVSESRASTQQDTTRKGEESILELIKKDTTKTAAEAETLEQFTAQNPLFGILRPHVDQNGQPYQGSLIGLASFRDTATVNKYLKMNQIRALFPRDVRFYWSQEPYKYDDTKTFYELHAIKVTTRDGRAPLDGSVITSARPTTGVIASDIKVEMSMNAEGAKTWARLTRENIGRCIAVVLDVYVRSWPRVTTEITGGNSEITGNFTLEEAQDLANILLSGKLPAPARIVSDTVVGPTLGKEAIKSGVTSFAIAFLLVLAYMIFYYSHKAGVVTDIALLANVFLLFGVLASLNAVLTLPGIAGIVLTMGMAVDANVLIYERIREELRAGKGLKLAIADGYRRAYSAIIDSNVTTLLTGIVLYVFGTGPIRGFATTLVIGIVTSLFTAIFITRLIFEAQLKRNKELTFSIPLTANLLKNTKIDFIGVRKYFYTLSAVILIAGIVSLFARGLNMGIDFTGGRTFVVRFDEPVKTADVAQRLNSVFGQMPQVVTFGSENQVKITTKYKINEPGAEDEVETLLYQGLKDMVGGNLSKEEFLSKYRVSSETIGPTIASDIKIKAFYSVGIALVIIFFYIFLRFRTWQFGFGAVASLFHDTLFVIGIYSLLWGIMPFSMEIDQAFIAAILTVIGYSVNDTVIIYDRVREYLPIYRKRPFKDILNSAINSTLSRTINTSLTTLLTIIAIFIFGGAVIRGFIFALMIGIFVGTYSSIFVAAALMYDTSKKMKTAQPEQK